ncbi:hypothetical protein MUN82_10790 [Hymenobacter aerilatus]|uniref:Uncharacterized protein n=1 Tax=Hymenobacter aerilatus TaxID=2932251 RepID=A0A8T9T1N5_9BACT|nr:hypothetical protein [Hymenobacter aerilatus]UOR07561.1 hypothetical protein MUN82_10790 [Hymenobacter aerilatus]
MKTLLLYWSIATLTSERASIQDPKVRELTDSSLKTQKREMQQRLQQEKARQIIHSLSAARGTPNYVAPTGSLRRILPYDAVCLPSVAFALCIFCNTWCWPG